jgi:hypothetical protein
MKNEQKNIYFYLLQFCFIVCASQRLARSITSSVRPVVIPRIGICAMLKVLYFYKVKIYFVHIVRHLLHGFVRVVDT